MFNNFAPLGLFEPNLDSLHDGQMIHDAIVAHVVVQSLDHVENSSFARHWPFVLFLNSLPASDSMILEREFVVLAQRMPVPVF